MGSGPHGTLAVEVRYCVECGYMPMAMWLATELLKDFGSNVAIALAPVDRGRFEVALEGAEVYRGQDHDVVGIDYAGVVEVKGAIQERLAA